MGEVRYMFDATLSESQRVHWEHQLEAAERARDYALRMLGRLPIELGIDEEPPIA